MRGSSCPAPPPPAAAAATDAWGCWARRLSGGAPTLLLLLLQLLQSINGEEVERCAPPPARLPAAAVPACIAVSAGQLFRWLGMTRSRTVTMAVMHSPLRTAP